jgi:hypothetical protein
VPSPAAGKVIYDLKAGIISGEHALPGDREMRWTVAFSEDGRQLEAASDSTRHTFELSVTP